MTERTVAQQSSRFRDFFRISRFYFEIFKGVLLLKFQRKVKLQDPQEVLCQKYGDELQVLNVTTEDLVKFGDNYSSTIIKATIDITKNDGQTERLNLVAKMLPASQFIRKFMKVDVLMQKEIFLYQEIIPAYQELYSGEFDIAPEFYGGRLTLKAGESTVDDGAVLLIENLKESGYVMEERLKGLTMDHLRVALPAIAKFHAIGLAMKQKNPEFFRKMKDHAKPPEFPPEFGNLFVSKLLNAVKDKRELRKYYERVKLHALFDTNGNYTLVKDMDPENPYACLIHRDLWINNTMFHRNDGKIDCFKFFDFQLYGISSPMTDLMYFLFTSLPRSFGDFDEAVKLYRKSICNELRKLECDSSLFEGENFDKRLKEDAKLELYRCLAMSRNIEVRSKWDMIRFSNETVQRMKRVLEIYDSKGWLDG